MTTTSSGGDFLAKKSDTVHLSKQLPTISNILIVEDESFDADRLGATLRIILGQDVVVRRASTLTAALDAVMQNNQS